MLDAGGDRVLAGAGVDDGAISGARPGPTVTCRRRPSALTNSRSVVPMSMMMSPGLRENVTRGAVGGDGHRVGAGRRR